AIPGMEAGMLEANLMKRIADAQEIINPVFYLAGESYTTGTTLIVDGGMLSK
ncbi:MAG: NAD(P)-dependent dehydrogenase (short-subunit alcohol dehydrogenase family), partial [Halioglobus sp.]